ncbi:MAG: sugar transferase [Anaerobutyricum hallii]
MDIAGGLAAAFPHRNPRIFVAPLSISSHRDTIFFKQTRVGKNGKLFQMYKFRSMYMDAEERKAELMKENRVQDGMMFKLDFDPRIIGSKKLRDGTIKKGVGNFIRDLSLMNSHSSFNNCRRTMHRPVGVRDIIGTTRENSSIYARHMWIKRFMIIRFFIAAAGSHYSGS